MLFAGGNLPPGLGNLNLSLWGPLNLFLGPHFEGKKKTTTQTLGTVLCSYTSGSFLYEETDLLFLYG